MNKPAPKRKANVPTTDLRGASRLAIEATIGITDLVENLHRNIAGASSPMGEVSLAPTRGITGLVYRSIRGVTRLVGGSLDALLGQVSALTGPDSGLSSPERDKLLAALNGVLGDHLESTGNPLAIGMHWRFEGQPIEMQASALAALAPRLSGRVLLLVHGLCIGAAQWLRNDHDHGVALAAEGGCTPLYLHYNSGLHVSTNGRLLAEQLQALELAWPVPLTELTMLGYSMGGLVVRSACHQAQQLGHTWPRRLKRIVFLGTPHHGAPLERAGHGLELVLGASPYLAAYSRLVKVRSAGITDLRHGNLLDEDWTDTDRFARGRDTRTPVPLPPGVDCYAIAGSLGQSSGALREKLLGDGLVPLDSALGRHKQPQRCLRFPPQQTWIAQDTNHLDLLGSAEVQAQLESWLT